MKKIFLLAAGAAMIFTSCDNVKVQTIENDSKASSGVSIKTGDEALAQAQLETPIPVEVQGTIVDVAVGNENFSTLVAAVKAAGLVETLSSTGPFTVFAPTNDAFGKLADGTVATLLKPENKATLTDILTYHVVSGKYMAADVVKAIKENKGKFETNTVMGEKITLMLDGSNVVIKDAKGGKSVIVMTDVAATNGVIHAINTVIMPKG